jgi:photosystem II stability/assembly factor-like uncharacterized protein
VLAPPRPPARPDELEALIPEARARQRRRRIVQAAGVAVALGVALAASAALVGRGADRHAASGDTAATGSRGGEAGRVPIVRVGSSGGVTWAINGTGMWLTTNGGHTWRPSLPPHVAKTGDAIARVVQVEFFDRRHGWIFAVDVRAGTRPAWPRHAELDWTSDGGRTWHWTAPAGCCGNVSFVTPRHGYALGPSQLLSTTDGGATWKPISRSPFGLGMPAFVDARDGVAVAGKGDFFRTTDGGGHWTPIRLAGRARGWDLVLSRIATFGRRLVVPADRYVQRTDAFRLAAYVSADGGATWTVRLAPRWWVPVVGSDDPQEFSAVGPTTWFSAARRALLVTEDAGRSWRVVRPVGLPPRWSLGSIAFTSARDGWAIFLAPAPRARSVLMRTTDGGVHWAPAGPRRPTHHRR